jgi:AcrR family transcriptional regulator
VARTRGRRPGGTDTRGAIAAEARRQFGERGYAETTLRSVAAGAGVDPRLVLHYFGSKRGLFKEAVELPIDPALIVETVLSGDEGDVGARGARLILGVLRDPGPRLVITGLLRAAVTDPEAADLIREVLTERMLLPIARGIGADRPELRASLAASQVVGLVIARHVVGLEALATAPDSQLATALAPVLTHYLSGTWPEPVDGDDPVGA